MENTKIGQENAEMLREVGKASYRALLEAKSGIRPGRKLIDVACDVEKYLKESGYGMAFPINLSIGTQAAHYTPSVADEKVFGEGDVIKVDFGAEKQGILGDCALTMDLSGNYQKLVEATDLALQNAISIVKSGVKVSAVGIEIGKTIRSMGFEPIKNLGGHSVEKHSLHSNIFIPNYDNKDETELEEGQVIAIEPFATDGAGFVTESDICDIFSFGQSVSVRSSDARLLLKHIESNYPSEPFAARWLVGVLESDFRLYAAIAELCRAEALVRYPTLMETSKGIVAQSEVEVLVGKDSCEVLTK